MKTQIQTYLNTANLITCRNDNDTNSSRELDENDNTNPIKIETNRGIGLDCGGCGKDIRERTVLCVGDTNWHSQCLRCCTCAKPLDDQQTCFLREMRLYCKSDYALTFGTKCAKCGRSISAGDWVRRAKDRVYHLACFACDACSRQLSTGEQFALLEFRLLCKIHYLDVIDGSNTSSSEDYDSENGGRSSKTKRVRTTFTEEQLSILQANFQIDSNPDGQDLERIAQVTGLSKRVTQVWFQNSRARQKKHSGRIKSQVSHSSPLPHRFGELYPSNMVPGCFGNYQGSENSESPKTPLTPSSTPLTTHLQLPEFCHRAK